MSAYVNPNTSQTLYPLHHATHRYILEWVLYHLLDIVVFIKTWFA